MRSGVLGRLGRQWSLRHLGDATAALAFYSLLALFPFLFFVVALAGPLIPPARIEQVVAAWLHEAPPAVLQIVLAHVQRVREGARAGLPTFAAAASLWSATSGVVSLTRTLNAAYGVEETRAAWKVYARALVVVVLGAVLALGAALLVVAVPAIRSYLPPASARTLVELRWPLAALMMMTFWAALYRVLPNVRQSVSRVIPGSVVGVVVWLVASAGLSSYLARFPTFRVTYGALGGIILLLLWIWLSALALMVGAEVNAVLFRVRTQRG